MQSFNISYIHCQQFVTKMRYNIFVAGQYGVSFHWGEIYKTKNTVDILSFGKDTLYPQGMYLAISSTFVDSDILSMLGLDWFLILGRYLSIDYVDILVVGSLFHVCNAQYFMFHCRGKIASSNCVYTIISSNFDFLLLKIFTIKV